MFFVNSSNDSQYYRIEVDRHCNEKIYRNICERAKDAELNPKNKHAHTFDIDHNRRHLRDLSTIERKCIQKYYNSLNKSVYQTQKHHFIYCKLLTNHKRNLAYLRINAVILIKPSSKFYCHRQILEDFLFIDVSVQEYSV